MVLKIFFVPTGFESKISKILKFDPIYSLFYLDNFALFNDLSELQISIATAESCNLLE